MIIGEGYRSGRALTAGLLALGLAGCAGGAREAQPTHDVSPDVARIAIAIGMGCSLKDVSGNQTMQPDIHKTEVPVELSFTQTPESRDAREQYADGQPDSNDVRWTSETITAGLYSDNPEKDQLKNPTATMVVVGAATEGNLSLFLPVGLPKGSSLVVSSRQTVQTGEGSTEWETISSIPCGVMTRGQDGSWSRMSMPSSDLDQRVVETYGPGQVPDPNSFPS